jgi:hypothetical protein
MLPLDDSLTPAGGALLVELLVCRLRALQDKIGDQLEVEQRREARRTGIPPPSPNAAAVRAKFDRLLWKYRFRDPSTRSTLHLRTLRAVSHSDVPPRVGPGRPFAVKAARAHAARVD